MDDSKASKLARLNAASVTLQNFDGPGKGCPLAATTFDAQQAEIKSGTDASSSASLSFMSLVPVPVAAVPGNEIGGGASVDIRFPSFVTDSGSTPSQSEQDGTNNPKDSNIGPVTCGTDTEYAANLYATWEQHLPVFFHYLTHIVLLVAHAFRYIAMAGIARPQERGQHQPARAGHAHVRASSSFFISFLLVSI